MSIRTTRVEIFGFSPERKEAWKSLATECQRMYNRLWQVWLCHHAGNGSAESMRAHFDSGNKKAKWPVDVMGVKHTKTITRGKKKGQESSVAILDDSASDQSLYRILAKEFPSVASRTRSLLTQKWKTTLMSRKAARGNLPGWLSILFANESLPSSTRPQPIPFDSQNAALQKEGDKYFCDMRIERLGDREVVSERCELMLKKRKCVSVRAAVDKILSGEYKWRGCNLVYDRGKWYVSIAYEMPPRSRVSLDSNKILFVRPAYHSPWRVSIGGLGSWPFGGNGAHVEFARRAIIQQRNSRKAHYRWSGSNQKGHGRGRAQAVWTKLSSRWRDFTKRYNNEVSRQLINLAVSRGCGRIIYMQPTDGKAKNRFLSVAGNDFRSAMSWEFFQFGTMLASKCEAEGIEYGVAKKSKATGSSVRGVRKAVRPVA